MKAFVLAEPGVVRWHDAPEPELVPYGAILKPIAVTPCSSDVHTVFGGGSPKQPNLVLGHECIAEVLEVGSEVKDFRPGDRVAVPAITPDWRDKSIQDGNYKHASAPFSGHQLGRTQPGVFSERFLIRDADTTLAHIPEGITDEQALMCVDVVTTGFTGAEYADIKIGDTVCVLGIGPIGLMAVAGAALQGAGRIIAVGTRPICVELAKRYGATEVLSYKDGDIVEQVKQMTEGIGVDATIIAGGNAEVLTQAYDMTRYGIGTISNINYFGGTGYLPLPIFSGGRGMCGKTLHMELAKGGRMRIERILSMVQYGRLDPSPLVTHHLEGLEKVEDALYMMRDKPKDLVKVMVRCV
ncbi:alcohol dehydrogenase zinc-containing [Roseburia sp. CAG:309]|nr:alcohol dehydrogenase zinc-containing [Roseburia sp. CAG:309]